MTNLHPLLKAYLEHARLARRCFKNNERLNGNIWQIKAESYKREYLEAK